MPDFLAIFFQYAVICGPAVVGIIWFVISLVMFKRTEKDSPKYKGRKVMLIVSACTAGAVVLATVSLMILFFIAVTHM